MAKLRTRGHPPKTNLSRSNASASGSALTPPAQCTPPDGNLNADPDRFTTCNEATVTITDYTIVDGVPGPPTGLFQFDLLEWDNFSATSSTWTHGMVVGTGTGMGTLDAGVEASMYPECFLAQGVCNVAVNNIPSTPDPQVFTMGNNQTYDFEWTEADQGPTITTEDQTNLLTNFLGTGWEFTTPDAGQSNGTTDLGGNGRCDTIATSTDGCVDYLNIPVVTYDATVKPLIAPIAQHVYDAQHGGLVTAWGADPSIISNGDFLTRDMDQADIDANRQVACGNVTVPPGDQCDEFPLASTHQGASLNSDFSTAIVPASANQSQGGIMSTFYSSNRVIDGDPFLLDAVLADGTVSW